MKEIELDVTTAADGTGNTSAAEGAVYGLLYAVEWKDGDFADGVDAVLSVTKTASAVDQTLLTLTNANDDDWYYPQELVHDNTGTETAYYTYPVVAGTLKLTITSGGNAKTGGCICYVLE